MANLRRSEEKKTRHQFLTPGPNSLCQNLTNHEAVIDDVTRPIEVVALVVIAPVEIGTIRAMAGPPVRRARILDEEAELTAFLEVGIGNVRSWFFRRDAILVASRAPRRIASTHRGCPNPPSCRRRTELRRFR
jgi:hypothetical protein